MPVAKLIETDSKNPEVPEIVAVEEIVVAGTVKEKAEKPTSQTITHEVLNTQPQLVEINKKIVEELREALTQETVRKPVVEVIEPEAPELEIEQVLPLIETQLQSGAIVENIVVPKALQVDKTEMVLPLDILTEYAVTPEEIQALEAWEATELTNSLEGLDAELEFDAEIETYSEFSAKAAQSADNELGDEFASTDHIEAEKVALDQTDYEIEVLLHGASVTEVVGTQQLDSKVETQLEVPISEFIVTAEVAALRQEIVEMTNPVLKETVQTEQTVERTGKVLVITDSPSEFIRAVEARSEEEPIVELEQILIENTEPTISIEKLASYLASDIVEVEPQSEKVIAILHEIAAGMPRTELELQVDEMLPEVVLQKVVELFGELGFERPLEAVKDYFEEHGVAEGLSILNYVANLARAFDAQEISPVTTRVKEDITAVVHALGSVLLRLTAKKMLEPTA